MLVIVCCIFYNDVTSMPAGILEILWVAIIES
jgi:hypothetical protein